MYQSVNDNTLISSRVTQTRQPKTHVILRTISDLQNCDLSMATHLTVELDHSISHLDLSRITHLTLGYRFNQPLTGCDLA